jgi:hypothetical protein
LQTRHLPAEEFDAMFAEDDGKLSEDECFAEFDRLFPHGFAGDDVIREIAPQGWADSPLLAVFHPSAEQIYEECVRIHRNVQSLARPGHKGPTPPEPSLEEIKKDHSATPVEVEEEVRSLVGRCVWEIFSDNHEVIAPDARIFDLGSFRYAGGMLADYLNRKLETSRYDYMDFYLGAVWVTDRADLTPVYEMIFRRLKNRGCDWVYHFPTIHAIDFRPLRDALKEKESPEWVNYSPEESLAKEQDDAKRDHELAELRERLNEGNREAMAEAATQPPPRTVAAYQAVYGRDPQGWPPVV